MQSSKRRCRWYAGVVGYLVHMGRPLGIILQEELDIVSIGNKISEKGRNLRSYQRPSVPGPSVSSTC